MKVVILAGGLGTRISEESGVRPKPMIEIGGRPILWHVMKMYSQFGLNEFVICCGYRGYMIKEYFCNYFLHTTDLTVDLAKNDLQFHDRRSESWKVTLIDTGFDTMTGGRIKRIQPYIGNEPFCLTYGDGLSDVNISELIKFHEAKGKLATVTAVRPPGRFGALSIYNGHVESFEEKPRGDGAYINGGFFVLSPKVFEYIDGDSTTWEQEPMRGLTSDGQLSAFVHDGFWHPMDTLRDKVHLDQLWTNQVAPWKTW